MTATLFWAHSHRYVHRDVQPSNVLSLDHVNARLMDWGFSQPMNLADSFVFLCSLPSRLVCVCLHFFLKNAHKDTQHNP